MRISKIFFVSFLVLASVACTTVPQSPVNFSQINVGNEASITVVMSDIPDPGMAYPGAGCLLCLGVAAAANSDLSKYSKTLPTDDFLSFGEDAHNVLLERGIDVELSENIFVNKDLSKSTSKEMNVAAKNHSILKDTFDTTHLLVIRLDS